jgi:hypothetical protein
VLTAEYQRIRTRELFRGRVVTKRTATPINPKRASLKRLRADLTRAVAAFLSDQAPSIAAQVGRMLDARGMRKADIPDAELAAIEAIVAGIDFAGWSVLVGDIEALLADVVRDGTVAAFAQIGINVEARREVVNVVSAHAVEYGRQRAAEMVGMRVDALGSLIPNPRAAWQITEGTRIHLRAAVRKAIEEGLSNDSLSAEIAQSYGFSNARATVIARTETNRASNAGALEGYKVSGVVGTKTWLTAEDDKVTPDCAANGEAGAIPLTARFPSGAESPPDHPNAVFAGTLFVPYGELEEMVGADYHGPAVLIKTAEGKALPVGPNHPVLTQAGMIRASEIRKGDYLVYDARVDDAALIGSQPDFDQVPFVEDAFQAILSAGGLSRVASTGHDLHGDRMYCKGEIKVVEPTHRLLPVLDPCGVEKMRQRKFMRPHVQAVAPTGQGACRFAGDAVDLSPAGCMRGILPATHFRFLLVQSIHYATFDGKAFDATTASGVYNSHGFVVSNCRCTLLPGVDWNAVDAIPISLTE